MRKDLPRIFLSRRDSPYTDDRVTAKQTELDGGLGDDIDVDIDGDVDGDLGSESVDE